MKEGDNALAGAVTLIAGPTASGKSGLATALAERLDALVVNADSMQVYRDLDILTARPPATDLARAEHRLYGHLDAATPYSVAAWRAEVAAILRAAAQDNRPVVLVGGTGLYFKALTQGLSRIPPIPDAIRARWRTQADAAPAGALHAALAARDPVMAARLAPGDTQRLVRALEVIDGTGRSLADWQGTRDAPLVPASAQRLVLAPPRPWLHARIASRFSAMVAAGAVEEARALLARDLDPTLPAMKAIGVRELGALPDDRAGLEAACARATTDTRRYAKRQETFFRGQLPDWPRIDPSAMDVAELVDTLSDTMRKTTC